MKTQNSSNPASVRATETILDDGRILAQPGAVGEVLDSETYPDGTVALTVSFPGVTGCTTCFLGQDVAPVLALVGPPSEAPATAPASGRASRARVSRRVLYGAVAAAAASLMALTAWTSSCSPREMVARLPAVGDALTVFLTDGGPLPAREEDIPSNWLRAPCPKAPSVRTYAGACFVATSERPPCALGHELRGECVIPINKGQRFPSSIHADPR